jgi:uncharacterized protein (DUF934 family)
MALIRRRASAPQREPRREDFEVVELDGWRNAADGEPLPEGDVLVSFARFQAERDALLARPGRVGVRVPNDTRPELLEAVTGAALVALEFPTQRDGRAYSLARVLRQRFGYGGEIRATGKVVRDQLAYLARVGFDAFELSRGSAHDALASFDDLSVQYQASTDQPLPLWKRVARA